MSPSSQSAPRRQPRASKARAPRRGASPAPVEILRATQDVLLAEGVDGVSIRKVSLRCGYSAPTIYHHFRDKNGLIDALLEERFRVIHRLMDEIPRGGDPAAHLRDMARAFVRFARANPEHYALLMAPRLGTADAVPSAEAARALVKSSLEELAAKGTLAISDTEAAFQLLWATLHGVISLYLGQHERPVAENLDELAFDLVERGLLRPGRMRS